MASSKIQDTVKKDGLTKTMKSLFFRKKSLSTQRSNPPKSPTSPAPQERSAFFSKLPFEIRALIYELYFKRYIIHLEKLGSTTAYVACTREEEEWDGHRHLACLQVNEIEREGEFHRGKILPLCMTSKRMYDEAMAFLYSTCRFTISQSELLLKCDQVNGGIFHGPNLSNIKRLTFHHKFHRFPQITTNTLHDTTMPKWKSICRTLASMPNLTDLLIQLQQYYFFVGIKGTSELTDLMVGLLQPLKQIKPEAGKDRYQVRLGWLLADEERSALGECPFTLVETGGRGYKPNPRASIFGGLFGRSARS